MSFLEKSRSWQEICHFPSGFFSFISTSAWNAMLGDIHSTSASKTGLPGIAHGTIVHHMCLLSYSFPQIISWIPWRSSNWLGIRASPSLGSSGTGDGFHFTEDVVKSFIIQYVMFHNSIKGIEDCLNLTFQHSSHMRRCRRIKFPFNVVLKVMLRSLLTAISPVNPCLSSL